MDRRGADRRGRTRFEIVGELWGSIEARSTLHVRNMGLGGVLVESPVPLTPGAVHWLTADVDGEPQMLQVRVRHATPASPSSPCLAGLEFVGLTPALEAVVQEHLGSAGNGAVEPR